MANLPLNLIEPSRGLKNQRSEITLGTDAVVVVDGRPMASSYEVAQTFHKQHKNVLQRIELLECSDEFRELNFQLTEQTQKIGATTRNMPYYRMTFDGFVFLVGSFTGKKAAAFKEAYIARFNWMRDELIRRQFEAEQPAPAKSKSPKALPNGLTSDQQKAIQGLVKARVESVPKALQGKAAITCWSALKSKFGLSSYKAIPVEHFAEALSLVARLPLEGEVITASNTGAGTWVEDDLFYQVYTMALRVQAIDDVFRHNRVAQSLRDLGCPFVGNLLYHLRGGTDSSRLLLRSLAQEFDAVQQRLGVNQYARY